MWGRSRAIEEIFSERVRVFRPNQILNKPPGKTKIYVELGMTAIALVPFDPKMTSNELNGGCIFWQIIIKGKLGVILTIWGYSCNDWAR